MARSRKAPKGAQAGCRITGSKMSDTLQARPSMIVPSLRHSDLGKATRLLLLLRVPAMSCCFMCWCCPFEGAKNAGASRVAKTCDKYCT
jgi:hypothetical protein